jgi:hypothetical protein
MTKATTIEDPKYDAEGNMIPPREEGETAAEYKARLAKEGPKPARKVGESEEDYQTRTGLGNAAALENGKALYDLIAALGEESADKNGRATVTDVIVTTQAWKVLQNWMATQPGLVSAPRNGRDPQGVLNIGVVRVSA